MLSQAKPLLAPLRTPLLVMPISRAALQASACAAPASKEAPFELAVPSASCACFLADRERDMRSRELALARASAGESWARWLVRPKDEARPSVVGLASAAADAESAPPSASAAAAAALAAALAALAAERPAVGTSTLTSSPPVGASLLALASEASALEALAALAALIWAMAEMAVLMFC
jgi:hypothetical protein